MLKMPYSCWLSGQFWQYFGKSYLFTKIGMFQRQPLNFGETYYFVVNSVKKAHVFRKRASFLRILRKWRTLPMGRNCRFSHEFNIFLRKMNIFKRRASFFWEFCENDARFPWVELVDFPKNS